jgi:alkanesulfonate monooxygenase SsuD/methylene tetrahydromethanopterin reductase-like flavin-dependent oxidoreductase (luciferase family)
MGNSLALYNPPLRIAEEMAMIDCISGGRLIAGFPLGTPMDTTFAYGQNPSTLREKYDEARRLILRAWSEPDPFAFNGRFTKLRYVNIWPRPIQRPHPPIWIPGGGARETWAMCARESYVFAALSYFGFDASRNVLGGYWQEMERHGRSRNPYQAGYLQFVGVAETHAEAMKLYREPAEYFYGRCLRVDPRYTSPPGYTTESSVRTAAMRPMQGVAQFQDRAPTFDQILERGYIVAGEPDEVAARLRQIATDLNVGQLMLLLQFGNMGKPLARYNTRLFAERVMPQIADLFEDQWEDHWWPQRLKTPVATAVA